MVSPNARIELRMSSFLKHFINIIVYNILFFLNVRNTRRVKKETCSNNLRTQKN